jgi:protein involved in polysaccharide export with SLBB domain
MRVLFTSVAALVLIAVGCSPPAKAPPAASLQAIQVSQAPASAPAAPEQEYKIQVGDQLDIKFFYNAELNEQVIVRPDGRISLQLVQEVVATGLTPAELTKVLVEKYGAELQKAEITVIVRSFGAQKIYVDGEVFKPGMFPILGVMTALQAISQAGGMKETAQAREVLIIRRGAGNRPMAFPVSLDKALDGTDMSQDIALAPFDIVYVPRSAITNVNIWVDQYIRRNIPIPISFQYSF